MYGVTGGKQWALLAQAPVVMAIDMEELSDYDDAAARDGRDESGTARGMARRRPRAVGAIVDDDDE